MAFLGSRTPLCGVRHTQFSRKLNVPMRLLFIASLIALSMTVANSEEMFDVVAEPVVEPETLAADVAETEAPVEMQPPEVSLEQEQQEAAPVEEGTRERSSIAAVYHASTAQASASPLTNGVQAGVAKQRAQLIGLAVLLALGIFILKAKVRVF